MGLSGNQQKVRSPSGSLFSFCQQEKYFKISPKEPCSPVLPSKHKKEEITSAWGAVVGMANLPAQPMGLTFPLHLAALLLKDHG